MKLKNVLSLFDGISCGRLALDRAGIKYEKYYASEIDKYAIAVARYNYPNTIFVGDIRNLEDRDFKDIDLIMGGSPCQNFSFSGKRQGMITKEKIEITSLEQYLELKKQKFEFEGQSYLFWEFVRLLKEIKPKWFLLENVRMAKKWKDVITNALEVESIEINSALVSAQNRKRLYWTNIFVKELPEDRRILLKDILELQIKGNLSDEYIQRRKLWKRWGNHFGSIYTSKSNTLCAIGKSDVILLEDLKRFLLPIECERLQTLPDNYTEYGLFDDGKVRKISDTQRYKMIGNGWTVDVIAWIFSFFKVINKGGI